MQRTSMAGVVLALSITGALGCRTELVTPVTAAKVTVDPVEISIAPGDALQFSAAVFDESDAYLEGVVVAWSSDEPRVVAVEPDGSARALAAGSARVSASFNGVSGSARVTVLSSPDCSPAGTRGEDKDKGKKRNGDDDDDDDDDDDADDDDDTGDTEDGVACDG